MFRSKTTGIRTCNGKSQDISELLELALANAGYTRERIVHYSFLVESALYEWRTRLPADAELVYSRNDTARDIEFNVALRGDRCDPFAVVPADASSAGGPSSATTPEMSAMVDRLLSGVGNEIRYTYRRGENRIRIRLPRRNVEDTVFRRNLLTLLIPLAVESLLETVASSVDALMLSFTDSFAMSAVTLIMAFSSIQGCLVLACVVAAVSLISQYWGIRDRSSIGTVAGVALKVTMLASFALGAVALACPRLLMGLYTNVPEIIARGVPYLRLIGISFLLSPFYRIYYCCLRSLGRAWASMTYTVVGSVVNIALNAVFIYGLFGAPKLGTLGVGVATLASAAVQVGLCGIDYLRQREFRIRWRGAPLFGNAIARKFFGNVIPTVAQCMAWILGSNIVAAVIGHMQADVVAANSLLALLMNMGISMQMGYGASAGLLIGRLLGRGRLEAAKHFGTVVICLAFKLGLCCAAVWMLVGNLLPLLPLDLNANAMRIVRILIPAVCLNTVFGILNASIGQGCLYTGGDAKGLLIADSLFMWGFLVPFSLLAARVFHMPELVLLAIIRNTETLSFPLKIARYRAFKWLNNLTGAK